MNRTEVLPFFKTCRAVKSQFDELTLSAEVKDDGRSKVAMSMCLTIFEQFAATLHLIEGRFSYHAPIMIRSMLEALADLRNLVADESYLKQLRFDNARYDAALFQDYSKDPSIQEEKARAKDLMEWAENARRIRDDLEASGFRKQSITDKFKRAGLMSQYIAYRVLCSPTHNQLTSLIARHAGDSDLRYHKDASEEMIHSLMSIAVVIACEAVKALPDFTDIVEADLKTALDRIDQAWDGLEKKGGTRS